jgi:hypothetical protein
MNRGVVVAVEDLAEQIKWWDALDKLGSLLESADFRKFMCMARECQHPDARWLVSLLPAGATVTWRELRDVMEDHKAVSPARVRKRGCRGAAAWRSGDGMRARATSSVPVVSE